MKATALGLTSRENGYFADWWNCLDFLVVVISLLEEMPLPNKVDLTVLRTFRVLRPLKSLSRFPELGRLVSATLESGPDLLSTVAVLIFVMFSSQFLDYNFTKETSDHDAGLLHIL